MKAPPKRRNPNESPGEKRLPEEMLPPHGKISVRPQIGNANLYQDFPQRVTRKRIVGKVKRGQWRMYDGVEFVRGCHWLRVRLIPEEERVSKGAYKEDVKFGWTKWECGDRPYKGRFELYKKPLVLISLFDGIGGARVAIDSLPSHDRFEVVKCFSSEIDQEAIGVRKKYERDQKKVNRRYKRAVELGDVANICRKKVCHKILLNSEVKRLRDLSLWGDELHFMVIAGPPCQDLSQANKKQEGLFGKKSRLFFHVPRIIWYLTTSLSTNIVHFLVENVSMKPEWEKLFSTFLGNVKPCKIDFNSGGCCASLMSRRRNYWCSATRNGGDVGIDQFYNAGCIHHAKAGKLTLEDVLEKHEIHDHEFFNIKTAEKVTHLSTLTRCINNVGQEKYWIRRKQREGLEDVVSNKRRAPENINEDLLGFPIGYTKDGERNEDDRRSLLGNTFMIFHIQYFLISFHEEMTHPKYAEKKGFIGARPQAVCEHESPNRKEKLDTFYKIEHLLNEMKFSELDDSADTDHYIMELVKHNAYKDLLSSRCCADEMKVKPAGCNTKEGTKV